MGSSSLMRGGNPQRVEFQSEVSDLTKDEHGEAQHELPLPYSVSRRVKSMELYVEEKDPKSSPPSLQSLLARREAFNQSAKMTYNNAAIDIITLSNVATLHCTAHCKRVSSLLEKTEAYLEETVLPDAPNSILVLHHCQQSLSSTAKEIKLVDRLISAIVSNINKDKLSTDVPGDYEVSELWGLTLLNVEFFERVMRALKSNKCLSDSMIASVLMSYARNNLHGLVTVADHLKFSSPLLLSQRSKQRSIIEAIVRLLPEFSTVLLPMSFLSSLLKKAVAASASTSCRRNLELRMSLQLHQATLGDILIPSKPSLDSSDRNPIYETDAVLRMFSIFFNLEADEVASFESDNFSEAPDLSAVRKVSQLLDSYLAKIALDTDLAPSKFTALASLALPSNARESSDELYKAVDNFLKVHPEINDSERNQLCKTINCQKLSQEACYNVIQNERLPVQMAIRVLFEHIKGGAADHCSPSFLRTTGEGCHIQNHHPASRTVQHLKLKVAKLETRLSMMEEQQAQRGQSHEKASSPNKMNTVMRSFAKFGNKLIKSCQWKNMTQSASRALTSVCRRGSSLDPASAPRRRLSSFHHPISACKRMPSLYHPTRPLPHKA